MSAAHRTALTKSIEALTESLASVSGAEKQKILSAIEEIELQLDEAAVNDLLRATEAIRQAIQGVEAVLSTVNARAPQQVKREVSDALKELKQLRDSG